jgi:hypothetical protein
VSKPEPINEMLLNMCQEVMEEFLQLAEASGEETPIPEEAVLSRAEANGFGAHDVERVLSMWDNSCKVMRIEENGLKVMYRV